jgi:tRNA(Ile)-lysidine synthase
MIQALTHSEFSSIMSNHFFLLEKKPHVALSFSGGSDSLALLILLNRWIKKRDGMLTLIHFNHKLRKESYLETVFTKKISKKLNLNFKILNWDNQKPESALMFKARYLRYKKIIDFCKKQKIITLMTAHHYNDSLETYLMRKERKFSTLGLAGIPTRNNRGDVQILRPLINICKE